MGANKPRGDLLVLSWIRKKIPRQLLDGEFIKWLVLIDRIDHPVPVLPHPAFIVEMQTMRVRIPRCIQPDPPQMFPVGRHGQRDVHCSFPGQGAIEKGFDLIRGWEATREVKEQSTELPLRSCSGVWRQPRRSHLFLEEGINGMIKARYLRWWRSNRRLPSPMGVIRCSGLNPPTQDVHFCIAQTLVQLGGGHQFVGIVVDDPSQDLACVQIAGNQNPGRNGL